MLLIVLLAETGPRLKDAPIQITIPKHKSLYVGPIKLVFVCIIVIAVEEVKVCGIREKCSLTTSVVSSTWATKAAVSHRLGLVLGY